jgi:hypothetical protein
MPQDAPAFNYSGQHYATSKLALPMLSEGLVDSVAMLNRTFKMLDALVPYPVVTNIGYNEPSDLAGSQVEGNVYYITALGGEDEDWDNKNRCYAVYIDAVWWFVPTAWAMFCVPLANTTTPFGTLQPYQRTSVTTDTWTTA